MLNLANKITLLRIIAAPLLIILLSLPSRITALTAAALFLAASLTDMVDGLVARRGNMVTTLGKFLDPLADKILVSTALVMLAALGWAPAWAAAVIIAREFAVTGLRTVAVEQGVVLAADRYGKLKTVLQITALCPLMLHYPWFGLDPAPVGLALLYVAVALTIFSGGNYLYNFYTNLLQTEKQSGRAEGRASAKHG